MNLERPSTIYRIMNDLRWNDKFVCLKCGNTKAIKGDDIYDRKCSKCKKNVSLTKYTAFEGLRFPIEKAYGILETLVENAEFDGDAKVIKMYNRKHSGRQGYEIVEDKDEWQNPNNICDEYQYLSVVDLIMRSKQREEKRKRKFNTVEQMEYSENKNGKPEPTEISENEIKEDKFNKRIDKIIEEINNRWRPSIGSLAKRIELEENTVSKFLKNIDKRIRLVYEGEPGDPLTSILSFISTYNNENSRDKITVRYFLGMAMVPMIGEWKYGLLKLNNKFYSINLVEDGDGEWSVYRVTVSVRDHRYIFKARERIEYGTPEWYELFKGE